MIILLCGRDQCGLNAHSVDPDSMRIESWSSVDKPSVPVWPRKLPFVQGQEWGYLSFAECPLASREPQAPSNGSWTRSSVVYDLL